MRIIAGEYKNRKLISPKGYNTRPTSEKLRGAIFNICQNDVEGATFLDLFSGSGAIGLEALSRGAHSATFIDSQRDSIRCIHANLEQLELQKRAQVILGDVFIVCKQLAGLGKQYDLIFADPPYGVGYGQKVVEFIDEGNLLAEGGVLFVEEESVASISSEGFQYLVLKDVRKVGSLTKLYQFIKGRLHQGP